MEVSSNIVIDMKNTHKPSANFLEPIEKIHEINTSSITSLAHPLHYDFTDSTNTQHSCPPQHPLTNSRHVRLHQFRQPGNPTELPGPRSIGIEQDSTTPSSTYSRRWCHASQCWWSSGKARPHGPSGSQQRWHPVANFKLE
jgi:hypothetical protein